MTGGEEVGIIPDIASKGVLALGADRRWPGKELPMDIHVNDVLKLKKAHPCGSQEWLVLRVGMDFKLRCQGCGHDVMVPRSKAEKNIRKVLRDGQLVENL